MALFGSDRPVMPSFKTPPDLDSSSRSPYDDLNRLEREKDRTQDRNGDRSAERNGARQDRAENRADDVRVQERMERALDLNGKEPHRDQERSADREPESTQSKTVQRPIRQSADGTDPLIQGLFSKLPEPSTEWPLRGAPEVAADGGKHLRPDVCAGRGRCRRGRYPGRADLRSLS